MNQENIDVIVERLENLKQQNTEDHEKIIAQTTKTNGTVKRHDKWIYGIVMAGSVVMFMGTIIVGLLGYIYFNEKEQINVKIEQSVKTSLSEALNQYNIIVK
ncbi:MAG: hypothetical protein WC679_14030 [Bacteroidales bacterium]|jgi:hypothetical protein